eukprot:7386642-Prymnesium_polylepis.6
MLLSPVSHGPRSVVSSAAALMLMLGLFAIAKRQHAIANDPFAYNPVGFGKVWDPGWESPAWPNVDCYEEMYNTNMSCMTVRPAASTETGSRAKRPALTNPRVVLQCFKRHGIGLLLNDTMQQLPFWYSQPLGHRWSQNAAGAAAALGVEENQKVLNFLTSHYHESYVGTYVDTVRCDSLRSHRGDPGPPPHPCCSGEAESDRRREQPP